MTIKAADLLPDVTLQPHQARIRDLAAKEPLRTLLVHSLGSGKTLSALAAAEAQKGPYAVLAPASLRSTWGSEQEKFTDETTPSEIRSYTAPNVSFNPHTVIFDEVQNLRNPQSQRAQKALALAAKAPQAILLSGTPIVNRPADLTVPLQILTGKKLSPEEFESRYVERKPVYDNLLWRAFNRPTRFETVVKNAPELKALFKGRVDWHEAHKPAAPSTVEDIPVTMSPVQERLYQAIWAKLPSAAKESLQQESSLSEEQLQRVISFLAGPRQVGLSPYRYMRTPDAYTAFTYSPKLQTALTKLQEKLKDPRAKALVFSNFIDAGLRPYAAALEQAGIPHAMFHGGLSDKARRQLVEDYNTGRIRAALLGPSGTEGLSFKGTQLVQLLDPHWQPVRPRQAVGRSLRFDSHADLPEELKHVHVQRFLSRLPLSGWNKILTRLGFDREDRTHAADDYLMTLAKRKEEINQRFLDLLREVGTPPPPKQASLNKEAVGANIRRLMHISNIFDKYPELSVPGGAATRDVLKTIASHPSAAQPGLFRQVLGGQPIQPHGQPGSEPYSYAPEIPNMLRRLAVDTYRGYLKPVTATPAPGIRPEPNLLDTLQRQSDAWRKQHLKRLANNYEDVTQADRDIFGKRVEWAKARIQKNLDPHQRIQELISGRHDPVRDVISEWDLNRLPSGPGSSLSYKGYPGSGGAFHYHAERAGEPYWIAGYPSAAGDYARQAYSESVIPAYVAQLHTPSLEQEGAFGPWTIHLARDTRRMRPQQITDLYGDRGYRPPSIHELRGMYGDVPDYEKVVTRPRSLQDHANAIWKRLPDGRWMRVYGKNPFAQAPEAAG
jgi:superfamily II DNA or RNA helicase